MTFVEHFLHHTAQYESPTSFWRWSAYTAIASVLRDNCFRTMGDHRVFPNIYTLLLAESAVQRKGHPVKICEELVKNVRNTKLISGRSSIQAILDELARGETDKTTGKITVGGSALFSASELSAGIVNDPEAVKILTDIYDFKDEYTSRLRGSGIFRIKNICFTMMAASNEELLRDLYDTKALYGGLLGRTFLIKPDEFRPANSLFAIRDTTVSFQQLVNKLGELSKLKGEFEIQSDAQKTYEDWYFPFRKSYENKSDKSGISGRIHTSVVKLAMILSVDQTKQLTICSCHMREAIDRCMSLIPNYQSFVMSSGKSTVSEVAAVLIEDIWISNNKMLTKQEFLLRHFYQFDLDVVDKCIDTLSQAGLLQQTVDPRSNAVEIRLTARCVEKFGLKEGTDATNKR